MRYSLSIAETPRDREALFSFRYPIYVEEMRKPQKHADHERRRIEDPLDASAYNIIAKNQSGEIVGCVRVNFSRDGELGCYEELLDMRAVGLDHPRHTSICTRLMISKAHRRSTLAARLSCACFELDLERHIRWNFIDCTDSVVPFFSGLGYVRTHGPTHPEYGLTNAMRLDLQDVEHLKGIGSVFCNVIENNSLRSAHSAIGKDNFNDPHSVRYVANGGV